MKYRIVLWISCTMVTAASVAGVLMARFLVSQLGGSVSDVVYGIPFRQIRWSGVWWFGICPVVAIPVAALLHRGAPDRPWLVSVYAAVAISVTFVLLALAMLGSIAVHEVV